MDGLREAVAGGRIDEQFVEACRRAARTEVRGRPAPSGGMAWSNEDIDDVVFDMVCGVKPEKIILAAASADNDKAFMGWLRVTLRSTLNQRARRTPGGRVIRAMDEALRDDPGRFVLTQDHWGLVGDDRLADSSHHDDEVLLRAAYEVETRLVTATPTATKTPPMAYRPDIRAVCEGILKLAGPLPKDRLAEIVARRFNVAFVERFGYLGDEEVHAAAQPVEADPPATIDEEAARWMLGQLTEEERQIFALRLRPGGVRGVGEALGMTKHKAGLLTKRVDTKMRHLAELAGDLSLSATHRLLKIIGQSEQLGHSVNEDDETDGH